MPSNRAYNVFLLVTFGIYCWIYPSSLFLLVTNQVPAGTEWMASLMLVLEGIVAIAWVIINYGTKRGLLSGLALIAVAFLVEAVGVTTGFPFGEYIYTDVLSPKLFIVPVGIMFAWVMIVLASFFTARMILKYFRPEAGVSQLLILSTFLAVSSDLLMEPVAFHIQGYWLWSGDSSLGYYGVPISNFIAWSVISMLMVSLLIKITGAGAPDPGSHKENPRFSFIPPMLYMMNLVMFASINISYKFYLAGAIGAVVGLGCIYLILRGRTFFSGLLRSNE